MAAHSEGLRLQVQRLDNGTFIATFLLGVNGSDQEQSLDRLFNPRKPAYDDQGALYYVVVVIFIYGLSIILMIASLVRKNKKDNSISNYMKDMDKVRRLERRQQKFKTRLIMQSKKAKDVLRCTSHAPLESVNGFDNRKREDTQQTKGRKSGWSQGSKELTTDPGTSSLSSLASPALDDRVPLVSPRRGQDIGSKDVGSSAESPKSHFDTSCGVPTIKQTERGMETEMLIHWEDNALTPEPSSPSLAVLKEEEEEDADTEQQQQKLQRNDANEDLRGGRFKLSPRQILVNIDNVETKLLVSVV